MVAAGSPGAFAQEAATPPAPATPQEVSGPEISMLIRGTMIALHHANLTGNYTVLKDLGAIEFQARNSAARLTDLFREFRERKLNLAAAAIFDAKLDDKPLLSKNGVLRLVGHFPTKPQEIIFDLTFVYELGQWRILSLNVGTRAAAASGDPPKKGDGAPPLPPVKPTN
jgi:hypothetical protein